MLKGKHILLGITGSIAAYKQAFPDKISCEGGELK
jgi:phosphopantothenoylcysteine synthetase/decarboxylase